MSQPPAAYDQAKAAAAEALAVLQAVVRLGGGIDLAFPAGAALQVNVGGISVFRIVSDLRGGAQAWLGVGEGPMAGQARSNASFDAVLRDMLAALVDLVGVRGFTNAVVKALPFYALPVTWRSR